VVVVVVIAAANLWAVTFTGLIKYRQIRCTV